MIYGSVCSGIESATVAWRGLGWQAAFFAETSAFPSAVLAHHYPDVPNLGDMTRLDGSRWRGKLDVLVGGTPCQAFSVAGSRRSLDDERGNLTLKFVEMANAVRPTWTVWENVPGVLSTRDNAFGCLLGGLAGEDTPVLPAGGKWTNAGVVSGPARTVAWRVLDAQYFGLAQRRSRVFVVAGAGGGIGPEQILFEHEGLRRDTPPCRKPWQDVAPTLSARTQGGGGLGTDFDLDGGLINQAFGGNNTSGPIDIATAVNAHGGPCGRMDFESETFIATTLRARDLTRGVDSDCTDTLIAHTLRGEGFDASEDGTGRGTPLVATAFSCKDGAGGAQAEIDADGLTSLRAASGGSSRSTMADSSVRRLTPRECERLQGFPDDYTLIPWRGNPLALCPDGHRYKAIGNSMAVPVMRWIGERIEAMMIARGTP